MSVVHIRKYRNRNKFICSSSINNIIELFNTNTIINNGVIKIYLCDNNKFVLIKVKDGRIYRLVGPNLIEILIHNIPSSWQCYIVYKDLTLGNIKELYNYLFGDE